MNYQETLDFLYTQLPMYQRQGTSAFKKDLTNIIALCDELSNPQDNYPCIHVAGTNGKGTVSHIIAAILQTYGLKVGLYTSPHYTDFRERIKVDGKWIAAPKVVEWVEDNKLLFDDISPSFFEITVAMAFDHFKGKEVDIAIIETGLGGRLDSTNIITPVLSVITQIGLDHQNMLGNTIYQIAGEKAGIIKDKIPVVVGKHQTSCDQVFMSKAARHHAPLTWANLAWAVVASESVVNISKEGQSISLSKHPAASPFLLENVTTALAATSIYLEQAGIAWDQQKIGDAISSFESITNYIGRWQIVNDKPLAITDSAHNVDALQKVIAQLDNIDYQNLHIVLGMVSDKDITQLLGLMPKNAQYYFVAADIVRALPPETLQKEALQFELKGKVYAKVIDGYNAALSQAQADDLIYIGGSSFVAGDLIAGLGVISN